MDFSFPRSQVFLTAIPKTGCTSAMNFFTNLEDWLEKRKINISEVDSCETIKIDYEDEPGMSIHEMNSKSQNYLVGIDFQPDVQTSIAAFRNPFDRFASFWFDKVIKLRDPHYFHFGLLNFPSFEKLTLDAIRASAKNYLSQNIHDAKNTDPHCRPQYYFYKPGMNYDLYIDTEKLSNLPKVLSEHADRYRVISNLEFPIFNRLRKTYSTDFYDEELSLLVRKFYQQDFNFIKEQSSVDFQSISDRDSQNLSFDLNEINKRRIQNAIKNFTSERDHLVSERDHLVSERDDLVSERDHLVSERDQLVSSRSWQFMAPARKVMGICRSVKGKFPPK
jgi:hypothetical protein